MASWMYRGRSLRSNRSIRSRRDSEDEIVQLDPSKDTCEKIYEILCNVFKRQGITEGRKLAYLNAFVNLISKSKTETLPTLGYNIEELLCCLRVTLVHEATQVRAAGLRTVRYLISDEQDLAALIRLHFPSLIARSLDVVLKNDMERIQAMRLCRKMLLHGAAIFPRELVRSLVSLASGGAEEKDRMLRVCLGILSEICILNPDLFISCGGVGALSHNLLEPHPPRVTEALAGALLFLLNHRQTRRTARVDLSVLAAPYSDLHYRHTSWGNEREKDDRETRFNCSRLALLSVLRSYPGVIHFSESGTSGLRSLVDVLSLHHLEARKAVLDLLYDLLGLPLPAWTDEASVALGAVDPSRQQDSWRLTEGFVAAEGKAILPNLSRHRPNLVEVHGALLLYSFVSAGLLEGLVDVVVTSDSFISLRAAILLGELLHLVHALLPAGCQRSTPSLPGLLAYASGKGGPAARQSALSALATLGRLHEMQKKRPAPCSLFLDQLLQFSDSWSKESIAGYKLPKSQLYQLVVREGQDCIKDSVVLSNKDPFFWNWNVIRAILKNRSDSFKRLEDSNQRTFIRRLVEYYKPSSNRFSHLNLGQKHAHPYTMVGCELLDFLVEVEEGEGSRALCELVSDISEQIGSITSGKSAHDCLFSPHHVTHSMCQDYFLFLGRLCHHSRGVRALEQAGVFQRLLDLVVNTNHDCYVKLVVSSLDYSIEGMPRVILGKVLKAPIEASRMYATRFLLVLVRARVSDFSKWGMELLVMQLYDTSHAVSLAASDILDEACDFKPYLEALVALRPSLLHLGDRGLLLLVRFLSLQSGFSYLHDANFVVHELERWNNTFNTKYVFIVEANLHDALTLHQKGEGGSYTERLSNAKHSVKDVYLPPHLLGQLAQHARGLELLSKEVPRLQRHCHIVRSAHTGSDADVTSLKASIWAVAHLCSSPGGLQLLLSEVDPPTTTMGPPLLSIVDCIVGLAEECEHYGVRAMAFYACSLLATTQPGATQLEKSGWACVRHARHERWPVVEADDSLPTIPVDGEMARGMEEVCLEQRESRRRRSTSQCSSQSATSWAAHFYIDTDEEENEDLSERGFVNAVVLRENTALSPHRRESGLGSMSPVPALPPPVTIKPPSHRRSQTLPQTKPARGSKHQRSFSESKGDGKQIFNSHSESSSPRRNSLVDAKQSTMFFGPGNMLVGAKKCSESVVRVRKKGMNHGVLGTSPVHLEMLQQTRCHNEGLDDRRTKSESEKLKNFLSVPENQSGTSQSGSSPAEKSRSNSCTDSTTSGVSSCDDYVIGRPLLGDRVQTLSPIPSSASLSTLKSAGLKGRGEVARTRGLSMQEDHSSMAEVDRAALGASWQDIQGFAALRALHRFRPPLYSDSTTADILGEQTRTRNTLGRHSSPSSLPDLEAPLKRVASSLSSVCSRPPTHLLPQHSGPCYRGIALPRDVSVMFPTPEKGPWRGITTRKRGPESFSELEEVLEAGSSQEDKEMRSSSEGEALPELNSEHEAAHCLACSSRAPPPPHHFSKNRRVSGGMHRTRTDTESSGERVDCDSPVLGKRTAILAAATPNSASSTSSLDLGMSQRTEEEAAAALSKHAVKTEILKHVERLANPVWSKSSRQVLLQLKQKFPQAFQDPCLYSDVCRHLSITTYRLGARRCIQELFFDCSFEELYEEPSAILRLQEPSSSSLSNLPSPFSSPSIAVGNVGESVEPKTMRALDVVAEEHSAASGGSGELVDAPLSGRSPSLTTAPHQYYNTKKTPCAVMQTIPSSSLSAKPANKELPIKSVDSTSSSHVPIRHSNNSNPTTSSNITRKSSNK